MPQFDPSIFSRELPIYWSNLIVPIFLPGLYLTSEHIHVPNPTIQALALKNAWLNFRHIQPTPVFRGVMISRRPAKRDASSGERAS
jgi:hypothetical protein